MAEQRMGLADAALKGALAGVIGGMAMAMATKMEQELLLPKGSEPGMPPVQLVRTEAEKRGVELSEPQAMAAGMGVHLSYSALWGAAFGVMQSRLHPPSLLHGLVLAGLVYAVGYSRWGIMPRSGTMPPPSQQPVERAMIPPASHAVFGLATAAAFERLA